MRWNGQAWGPVVRHVLSQDQSWRRGGWYSGFRGGLLVVAHLFTRTAQARKLLVECKQVVLDSLRCHFDAREQVGREIATGFRVDMLIRSSFQNRRVSTTLRQSVKEFTEYRRLLLVVC